MRPELIGALHGPLELLPVSSSAHLALLRSERAHGEDVALHLGSGLAMAPFEWRGIRDRWRLHLAAAAVPAVIGALADPFVERRLGGARSLAAGLLAGSAALAIADASAPGTAPAAGVPRSGVALGLAQACALWPGVSRTGAVLAAARALGYERTEAARLARETAVPVVLGAAAFKALRSPWTATTARATALSFASTLAARPLARLAERPLWPFALYRAGLALAVVRGSLQR